MRKGLWSQGISCITLTPGSSTNRASLNDADDRYHSSYRIHCSYHRATSDEMVKETNSSNRAQGYNNTNKLERRPSLVRNVEVSKSHSYYQMLQQANLESPKSAVCIFISRYPRHSLCVFPHYLTFLPLIRDSSQLDTVDKVENHPQRMMN